MILEKARKLSRGSANRFSGVSNLISEFSSEKLDREEIWGRREKQIHCCGVKINANIFASLKMYYLTNYSSDGKVEFSVSHEPSEIIQIWGSIIIGVQLLIMVIIIIINAENVLLNILWKP